MRNFIKKIIGLIFRFSLGLFYKKFNRGLTIFIFHEISDYPSKFAQQHSLAISLESFTRQIEWIKSNYEIVHPSSLLEVNNMPFNAAIISFDDGFLGSFENGLRILKKHDVPSIFFLNMQAILEQKPIASATACYIEKYVPEFKDFSKKHKILSPLHLTLTPCILNSFENEYDLIDKSLIMEYQGKFADISVLKKWDNKDLVVFGNHLFDHWNVAALSSEELKEQYVKNEIALSQFKNSINFFAFTNGQPEICFTKRDVAFIYNMGATKVFSAAGGINRNPSDFLLTRMSLCEKDEDEDYIWFKLGRSLFNELLHKNL